MCCDRCQFGSCFFFAAVTVYCGRMARVSEPLKTYAGREALSRRFRSPIQITSTGHPTPRSACRPGPYRYARDGTARRRGSRRRSEQRARRWRIARRHAREHSATALDVSGVSAKRRTERHDPWRSGKQWFVCFVEGGDEPCLRQPQSLRHRQKGVHQLNAKCWCRKCDFSRRLERPRVHLIFLGTASYLHFPTRNKESS